MLKKIFVAIIFAALLSINIGYAKEELAAVKTSDGWSLRLMKLDTLHYDFEIIDANGKRAALVPYNSRLYNFYYFKEKYGYPPLVFVMGIYNAPRDDDEGLGKWEGSTHYLPVYAIFDYAEDHGNSMHYKDDGRVTLESWFGSCGGLRASHYQGVIKSPYHMKLVEIFLTHMPELHREIKKKGINLP